MKNIPIVGKFLTIMAAFGIFALGVAFYTSAQLKSIDDSYSSLLEGEANSALLLARSNRSMQNMRAAIGDLVLSRTSELNEAATKDFTTARESFIKFIDGAAKSMPSNTDIPGLKAAVLQAVDTACAATRAAGTSASKNRRRRWLCRSGMPAGICRSRRVHGCTTR